MKFSRRGLFKAIAALPIALTVGLPPPAFHGVGKRHLVHRRIAAAGVGWNTGAGQLDASLPTLLNSFRELRDDWGVWMGMDTTVTYTPAEVGAQIVVDKVHYEEVQA